MSYIYIRCDETPAPHEDGPERCYLSLTLDVTCRRPFEDILDRNITITMRRVVGKWFLESADLDDLTHNERRLVWSEIQDSARFELEWLEKHGKIAHWIGSASFKNTESEVSP